MATHSSTLAWKIPWTEDPGRLQSVRSLRVRHDWATSLSLFTFMHWRRKWQPTQAFLPRESQGRGSLVGCRLWGLTELDTTEVIWQHQQQLRSVFVSIFCCLSAFSKCFLVRLLLLPAPLQWDVIYLILNFSHYSLPGSSDDKESSCNAGDPGLIPGSGRSSGGGDGNPLQYSCLGNPMGRGTRRATVHEVTKSWTHLSD